MSRLRISTMTACAYIGCAIDMDYLFNNLPVDYPVVYLKLNNKIRGKVESAKKKTRSFYNQVTMLFSCGEAGDKKKNINVKIFCNGNVQMTGLKNTESGREPLRFLLKFLFEHKQILQEQTEALDYRIVLINSDFPIGFSINRTKLHRIVQQEPYCLQSFYDPCIYPGVNIKYFYNEQSKNKMGVCQCSQMCTRKSNTKGKHSCKRLTCAVFQSGHLAKLFLYPWDLGVSNGAPKFIKINTLLF